MNFHRKASGNRGLSVCIKAEITMRKQKSPDKSRNHQTKAGGGEGGKGSHCAVIRTEMDALTAHL